ncbi:MAG: FAD-dependent oxidoreductase [Planctomycetota bacterium]
MTDNRQAAPQGRDHEAFPTLTERQLEQVKRFGHVESLPEGTVLFERGERSVDFYVVLEGRVEIYDYACDGTPTTITVHGESQFTGEIDLFSDRKILVGGRMAEDGQVIRVPRAQFRELLAAEPGVGEVVMRAFVLRRIGLLESNMGAAVLLGRRTDAATLRIRAFLRRNGYPVKVLYVDEDDKAREYAEQQGASDDDLPLLMCAGEEPLKSPTDLEVAQTVGLVEWPSSDRVYDLAVIGAGPGGMAAAVYGASEGLDTVVLERSAPGGQAGTSSKIENYLGFPNGLSGQELAGRAQVQAQKFGATLALPMTVTAIEGEEPPYAIQLAEHDPVRCRSIVIATGATYRTLDVDNYEDFEGRGIYYAATAIEGGLCEGEEVVVVGGGNSAGQAAVFLASRAKHVHMLVRGEELAASMSDYLIRRINASDAISLCCETTITRLEGKGSLERITWHDRKTDQETTHDIGRLFLMIGAKPNTSWIGQSLMADDRGFLKTGSDVVEAQRWKLERPPEPFETSLPNVFAIGDARCKSVKRVASAVGEGSVCIQSVHRVLSAAAADNG